MQTDIVNQSSPKDKLIYIVLTFVFVLLLAVAIYLFVQIQTSNKPLINISNVTQSNSAIAENPSVTEAPTPTPAPLTPEDLGPNETLSSAADNFTTLYPSNYQLKKETVSSTANRYTFSGNQTIIIITANSSKWNDGNPNIEVAGSEAQFANTTAYVYATDQYFRNDFKYKDKYYTLECAVANPTLSMSCAVVFDNFRFIN